jgi:hypothetical protein
VLLAMLRDLGSEMTQLAERLETCPSRTGLEDDKINK